MNETANSIEEIAIIGMSGRFPGARNITEFWQNLVDGIESIARFSDEELLSRGVPEEPSCHHRRCPRRGEIAARETTAIRFAGSRPRALVGSGVLALLVSSVRSSRACGRCTVETRTEDTSRRLAQKVSVG